MRDPELVARAQRAAARLESAWEQWRMLHGLAAAPSQPVVSYVGYSLTEPWGEPRVVIGIDADEAEFLADFLDRDECANTGQLPAQQVTPQITQHQGIQRHGIQHQGIPHQGMLSQALLAEAQQSPDGEYTSTALLGAPVSLGVPRQAIDPGREMSAEMAGWSSGELPGQASEQLAGWPPPQMSPQMSVPPPGLTAAAEQPPGAL